MLKKTIEFEDYDGNMRKEDHYFYLNESEVIKWLATNGDYTMDKVLDRISTERNGKMIMDVFEDLIHRSYGRKSLDGRKFEKTKEMWDDFYQTEAYSILFTELVTDSKKAADFINQIIPKSLSDKVEKIIRENPQALPESVRNSNVVIMNGGLNNA